MRTPERAGWPIEAWYRAQSVLAGRPSPDAQRVIAQNTARDRIDVWIRMGCLLLFLILGMGLALGSDLPDWMGDDSRHHSYPVGYIAPLAMIAAAVAVLVLQERREKRPDPRAALLPVERQDVDSAIEGEIETHPSWIPVVAEVARQRAATLAEGVVSALWPPLFALWYVSTSGLSFQILICAAVAFPTVQSARVVRRILLARSYLKVRDLPAVLP